MDVIGNVAGTAADAMQESTLRLASLTREKFLDFCSDSPPLERRSEESLVYHRDLRGTMIMFGGVAPQVHRRIE